MRKNRGLTFSLALMVVVMAGACSGGPATPAATLTHAASALLGAATEPISAVTDTAAAAALATAVAASSTAPAAAGTATPPALAAGATAATPMASVTPTETAVPDPVLLAAGDIADCQTTGDEATAQLVSAISGTVATLGDNAYELGSGEEFKNCFGPTWGVFKDRIHPAPGNHEYQTPGALGYFNYFGAAAGAIGQGYYSYDLGAWHVIVLNSQCWDVGGCGAAAPQSKWLQADLAAHTNLCTLAYWHTPRFSSGLHGDTSLIQSFWDLLYAGGGDVVLNGHDHDYERFAPQNPQGKADPARGIREFVVGTGGADRYPFLLGARPNSEVRNDATFGVLKLTLHPAGYDFEFLPVAGKTFTDVGNGACH